MKCLVDCGLQPTTTLWTPLGRCKGNSHAGSIATSRVSCSSGNAKPCLSRRPAIRDPSASYNARQRASATACAVVGATDRLPGDGFSLRVTFLSMAARAGPRRQSAKVRGRSKRLTNIGFSNRIWVIKAASASTRVLPPESLHARTDRRQLFFCGGATGLSASGSQPCEPDMG
jgi:hypothetical protein